MIPAPVLQVGNRRLTLLPLTAEQQQGLGAAIMRSRLGDVSLDGLTVEDAANRLAEHVEEHGAGPEFVAACYVECRAPAWSAASADELTGYLRTVTDADGRFQIRAAIAGVLYAFLLTSPDALGLSTCSAGAITRWTISTAYPHPLQELNVSDTEELVPGSAQVDSQKEVQQDSGIIVAGVRYVPGAHMGFARYGYITTQLWNVDLEGVNNAQDVATRVCQSGRIANILAGFLVPVSDAGPEAWTAEGAQALIKVINTVSDTETMTQLLTRLVRQLTDFMQSLLPPQSTD